MIWQADPAVIGEQVRLWATGPFGLGGLHPDFGLDARKLREAPVNVLAYGLDQAGVHALACIAGPAAHKSR